MIQEYTLRVVNAQEHLSKNISEGQELIMGRSETDASFVIANTGVSRKHLKLSIKNGNIAVVDLGSANGTYIHNKKLESGKEYYIKINEKVCLMSDGTVFLEIFPSKEKPETSKTLGEAKTLSEYLNKKSEIIIGRSTDCDIVLQDASISRKHAKVFKKDSRVFVQDLNSSNGVFVNSKRVNGTTLLGDGDTIFIGLTAFKLGEKQMDLSKEHAITTTGISKTFSNGYTGLQATDVKIPYKQMVALMGPSGCGKSTLMKALNGDSPPTKGTVKIFGLDLAEHFEMLKHIIGYVPQENIVHEDLTVEQSLYYAAKLRLSDDMAESQIKTRVSEVLEALRINTETIRKTKVSGLSGGQKKRVSIAVELLTKPKILFLDEPTSPLDPETIEEFLNCLRALCKEGTTVVMVTHKPDDLNYVDRVIFMGVGGHLVYEGAKEDLLRHFEKDNLIGLYGLLSNDKEAEKWYKKWYANKNAMLPNSKVIVVKKPITNIFRQTYWLSFRYFNIKIGNPKNLAIMLMQPVLIAILIMLAFEALFKTQTLPTGNIVSSPNVGILFLMAVASVWFGVSNSAKEIVGEKDILKREFMFNMKLGTYLSSKLLVLTLISAIQILILQTLLYIKFNDLAQFPLTWLFLMLISICSIQFGLLLSSFASSTEEVMSVLPIALMPQIILAGMIQPLENKITMLLSYFTLGRWGTEGIARIQDKANPSKPFMGLLDGHLYSESVGSVVDTNSLSANLVALCLLFLVTTVGIFVILNNKLNTGK